MFYMILSSFPSVFFICSVSDGKSCFSVRKSISTSKRRVEHPFAGRNTQQTQFKFTKKSKFKKLNFFRFWMTLLVIVSVPWVIFRICTLCFGYFRFVLVMSRTGLASGKELRKSVQFILTKCFLGDWFVLAQIGKNVNTYFFRY